ncbi:MAG TPA: DUF5996 family protein [Longimicrobiales bacterium]|nr:DUF5996 family protein [Longimicrobiales bacterium]
MSQGPGDSVDGRPDWPPLPLAAWNDTRHTLHMWTQIVGKIRLGLAPMENHWWQVPLYVTADGMTTSPMPYGSRALQIDFDLVEHRLRIRTSDGRRSALSLQPRSVADFHAELMGRLADLELPVEIDPRPSEVPDPVPFDQDHVSSAYDARWVESFFAALRQADRLLKRFRSGFLGKVSPVHFFWGSFDHAVTRFSGRGAPPHPGGFPNLPDWVTREAYNRELSSAGFWPGDARLPEPAFYSYAYPEPAGFRAESAGPAGAYHHEGLGEFVLPYESVRSSPDPDAAVLEFLEATYAAAARTGGWDRGELERHAPTPGEVKRMEARVDRAGQKKVAST